MHFLIISYKLHEEHIVKNKVKHRMMEAKIQKFTSENLNQIKVKKKYDN